MQIQMTPQEWENKYLPQFESYQNALELSLEPYVQGDRLFVSWPYAQQWQFRNYLFEQRRHLELYNLTAEWFVQNNLPRYMEKLMELKSNIDSIISLLVMQMDSQQFASVMSPFASSPAAPLPAESYSPFSAQQAETNQKILEIQRDSQKASFEHYERMHAMQEEMTKKINSFSI